MTKGQHNCVKTVAVFNQAGGVGKTTLTRDLGFELAGRGSRVLLVDADPQGTLGVFFGETPAERPATDLFWSSICMRGGPKGEPIRIQSEFGVHLGLANHTLIDDEWVLAQQHDPARLLGVFDRLKAEYDLILIDCPPKIAELTHQVLLAADALLIPVQPEGKAVVAFAEVHREILQVQQRRTNMRLPTIEVLGVVPTIFNPRLVLHRHHLEELRDRICASFGYPLFPAIRDYVSVAEAGTQGMPLKAYDARCAANQDVSAVADKLFDQIKVSSPLSEVVNG